MYHHWFGILLSSGYQIIDSEIMPPIPVPPPSPPPPLPPKKWPIPKFKITIEDLDHEGADIFLNAVQPKVALREATIASFNHLYTTETAPTKLVLRSIIFI